ncbi:hypothetical protein BJX66DRAFT_301863 [Aspergillus keveii]|uniref:Uncharacterized protein n=1 Tax=Aspergillus keveii TaxID=714993 RepID=A0ABR4G982_9EURO
MHNCQAGIRQETGQPLRASQPGDICDWANLMWALMTNARSTSSFAQHGGQITNIHLRFCYYEAAFGLSFPVLFSALAIVRHDSS